MGKKSNLTNKIEPYLIEQKMNKFTDIHILKAKLFYN